MPDFTSRLSLYLPGGGADGTITPDETADIDKLNDNFRAIDSSVGSSIVTSTTRPVTPFQGQLIYETDTGRTMMRQGSQWIPIGGNTGYRFVQRLIFTASGDFNKASYPWLRAVGVKVQGPGGGGGGSTATNRGGAGGSGGTYSESFITDLSLISSPIAVTVGLGGAGGANDTNGSNGTAESSFGSLVTGPAGIGGVSSASAFSTGTLPPAAGVGDLTIRGGSGGSKANSNTATTTASGYGGNSFMGFGGAGVTGSETGRAAMGYGGGGGGSSSAGNARTGGAGADGIVIVELYA
jgi:hypothetical protein